MASAPSQKAMRPSPFFNMIPAGVSIDPLALIAEYYPEGSALFDLLLSHSQDVTDWALCIAAHNPALPLDLPFIYEAAMLHDIGIFLTDAPSIHCHGSAPYIQHGILGAEMLRKHGLDRHALVAERHTSSGLSREEIVAEGLPLPLDRTYMPESLEEKIICLADCFFSKTRLGKKKSVESIREKMRKEWTKYQLAGPPLNLQRFNQLLELFTPKDKELFV